jgi:hypothetical protein
MKAYDSDTLTVTAVADSTLTASKLAPTGQSPASRVVLQNGPTANSEVLYRFDASPVPASNAGHRIEVKGSATIDGYENLVNLKLRLKGSSSATVFVTYYR